MKNILLTIFLVLAVYTITAVGTKSAKEKNVEVNYWEAFLNGLSELFYRKPLNEAEDLNSDLRQIDINKIGQIDRPFFNVNLNRIQFSRPQNVKTENKFSRR